MAVDRISQPIQIPIDYWEDAKNLLSSTHKHLIDSGLIPSTQYDTYKIPSEHIVNAIGKTGMRLSAYRERRPVYEELVPLSATVEVYNDILQAATLYEYDSSKHKEAWMYRLSTLDARKARPLTALGASGALAGRVKDTKMLRRTIDNPNPTSTGLANDLIEYATRHSSDHSQLSSYILPLSTKSTRQDHENDANAIFSIESVNNQVRKLSLDVATSHELDDTKLLRVISLDNKIDANNNSRMLSSTLSLYGRDINNRHTRMFMSHESEDVWQLYDYLKTGAATLKSAALLDGYN